MRIVKGLGMTSNDGSSIFNCLWSNAEPIMLTVDQRRIEQVMGNLLDNALRHTPDGGIITIRLEVQAGNVNIEILNSGSGFTPEALQRGFERFYTTPAQERRRSGSGLGLAIARSLVEAHGGSIHLSNTPTGALVRVTLPTHKTSANA